MIAVLVAMLPLVTCLWLSHVMTRSRRMATPEFTESEPTQAPVADRSPVPAPLRMDDAPALEAPVWTALDDMQLNRLLDEAS